VGWNEQTTLVSSVNEWQKWDMAVKTTLGGCKFGTCLLLALLVMYDRGLAVVLSMAALGALVVCYL
jgi:hypothetical protein